MIFQIGCPKLIDIFQGYLYEKGKGTEKDLEKAIYWYNKAAENGNKITQYSLLRCYQSGINVGIDEIAFEYCKKSAEKGYNEAQNFLGCLYENGKCTEKDLGKAICWYNKALESENKLAQYNLGRCY